MAKVENEGQAMNLPFLFPNQLLLLVTLCGSRACTYWPQANKGNKPTQ